MWGGRGKAKRLISVCPQRFYAADLVNDVIEHCWIGAHPANPRVAYEVQMAGFGKVDLVIADVDAAGAVSQFVSVELQAVDVTGSVVPAYEGVINSVDQVELSSGFNWANVRKRFVSQLITKGFYHHHWSTRMVAVLQTPLYERLHSYIEFEELEPGNKTSNILFMLYDFEPAESNRQIPAFQRVVATSHNSLMTGSLYRTVPHREEFCKRIVERLQT